ncbi:MAG: hypothetical protein GDA49_08560 [Rhodospirillales bacterium]|nr:hypothetical protein [Rhodospirillales bacterium]
MERKTWPDLAFQHLQPIGLRVSEVSFRSEVGTDDVTAPGRDIRYAMPALPKAVMARWSRERLTALGGPGRCVVTLTRNRFFEVPLDTTGGVEGFFTIDQSARYEGALALRIDIKGDASGTGFAEASASATRTVPEDFTLNEREQTLYDMLQSIVTVLDGRMEQEIRAGLSRWVG